MGSLTWMASEPGGYEPAATASFYDAYGAGEWRRLESTAYGRLQAAIHADFLREHVGQRDRVLDAGCGPGRFLIELVRLGTRPTALDTSPGQLALAREHCAAAGLDHHVDGFIEGDIIDLASFCDAQFDVTVCLGGALSYVREKRRHAVAELMRVTRPGGALIVSVMSRLGSLRNTIRAGDLGRLSDPEAGLWSILETGDLPGFPSRSVPGLEHPPMHLYTSAELVALFQGSKILAIAGSNVTVEEGDPMVETVAADDDAWEAASELERRPSRYPGLNDSGIHLIVSARRPPT